MPETALPAGMGKTMGNFTLSIHNALTLHVYKLFQNLVADRDDSGIGLEASLGSNHLGELLGHVYVGSFDVTGHKAGCAGRAGG